LHSRLCYDRLYRAWDWFRAGLRSVVSVGRQRNLNSSRLTPLQRANCTPGTRILKEPYFMPKNPNAKKEENSQSSTNIQIPKQTAGAVAGAAAGSIAGPIGAVVGGVVGAFAGKAAEKRRPIAPAARRTVQSVVKGSKAISKTSRRRRPSKKSVAKSRKARARSRGKAKKGGSRRSTTAKSRKAARTRERSTSSRVARKRSGGRSKRH
jgi:hypothetical protein